MAKKILQNQDLEFKIEILNELDQLMNYQLFETCKFTLYTTDKASGVTYTRTNLVDYVLHVPSSDLAKLKNGVIMLDYIISLEDDKYEDGEYTKAGTITTRYYLELPNNNENNSSKCGCCNGCI